MSATRPIAEARGKLGELARRAARHERITLTGRGVPAVVLVSPAEPEDVGDAPAPARLDGTARSGASGLPSRTPRHAAPCLRRSGGVASDLGGRLGAGCPGRGHRHLKGDPAGVDDLLYATDQPAGRPRPEGSRAWGADHRRLRHGRWRVLYRLDAEARTPYIEHVGRTEA
ncbi:type II toxin-antitoxin system prevent-host-death family antitoxin [Streptomyces sp. NPDC048392]|uniref:type II toxin-antitoxin system prevent-host-death family antitoxin n=1 Tax=Streptomyces sp. NPDC048392 TaxID=3365543 RepID=UPI003711B427